MAKTKFLSVKGEQSYMGWTEYLQSSSPSPPVTLLFESISIGKGVKEKVLGAFFAAIYLNDSPIWLTCWES